MFMYACVLLCVCSCGSVFDPICVHVFMSVSKCESASICVHVCAHICVCMHTWACIHIRSVCAAVKAPIQEVETNPAPI